MEQFLALLFRPTSSHVYINQTTISTNIRLSLFLLTCGTFNFSPVQIKVVLLQMVQARKTRSSLMLVGKTNPSVENVLGYSDFELNPFLVIKLWTVRKDKTMVITDAKSIELSCTVRRFFR